MWSGCRSERQLRSSRRKRRRGFVDWVADGASDVANPVTFTGRRYDDDTGLYYYRNRIYHAQLGRFISRDPIGYSGSFSVYAYVGSHPIQRQDPFGLQPVEAQKPKTGRKCRTYKVYEMVPSG